MFAAHATLPTGPPTGGGVASFVTRDSVTGNLMLDGQRFRFSGNNPQHLGLTSANSAYGAPVVGTFHLPNHAEVDATLDEAEDMNATVLRAYSAINTANNANAVQPTLGTFNPTAIEMADYLLLQCAIRGFKVILPLSENQNFSIIGNKFWYCTASGVTPDSNASQFFTNSTVIANFKTYINAMLNHVNAYTGIAWKNDPTILAWETGNELSMPTWGATQAAWTENIAAHIKVTQGAQQLVVDGHPILNPAAEFPFTLDLPHVDMYTNHLYENITDAGQNLDLIGGEVHSHGKAYFPGEYTWTDKDINGAALNWNLTELLSGVQHSMYADGDLFWALLAPLTNWGDGFALHFPGDNADMITRARQLADHALAMPSSLGNDNVQICDTVGAGIGTVRDRNATFSVKWIPQVGDVVVVAATANGLTSIVVPSGWTNVLGGNTTVQDGAGTLFCVYHVVTAAEATAVQRTYTATNILNTAMNGDVCGWVLRSVDTASVVDAAASGSNNSNTSPHVLPALTGSSLSDNSLVLSVVSKAGTGTYQTPTNWGFCESSNFVRGTAVVARNLSTTAGVNIAATNIVPSLGSPYTAITFAVAFQAAPVTVFPFTFPSNFAA